MSRDAKLILWASLAVVAGGIVVHFGATFLFWWPLVSKGCVSWP